MPFRRPTAGVLRQPRVSRDRRPRSPGRASDSRPGAQRGGSWPIGRVRPARSDAQIERSGRKRAPRRSGAGAGRFIETRRAIAGGAPGGRGRCGDPSRNAGRARPSARWGTARRAASGRRPCAGRSFGVAPSPFYGSTRFGSLGRLIARDVPTEGAGRVVRHEGARLGSVTDSPDRAPGAGPRRRRWPPVGPHASGRRVARERPCSRVALIDDFPGSSPSRPRRSSCPRTRRRTTPHPRKTRT